MQPFGDIQAYLRGIFTPARDGLLRRRTLDALRWIILALSVALIVFISIDIYNKVDFLRNRFYMKFQFGVCMVS